MLVVKGDHPTTTPILTERATQREIPRGSQDVMTVDEECFLARLFRLLTIFLNFNQN